MQYTQQEVSFSSPEASAYLSFACRTGNDYIASAPPLGERLEETPGRTQTVSSIVAVVTNEAAELWSIRECLLHYAIVVIPYLVLVVRIADGLGAFAGSLGGLILEQLTFIRS